MNPVIEALRPEIEAQIGFSFKRSEADAILTLIERRLGPVLAAAKEMRTSIGGVVGRDFAHKTYDAAVAKASAP